ncbi:MAG: hypothetical protein ACI9ES_002735 [Oceanospirillaceae bacterium]|jgi:hypothetical protein
MNYVNMDLRKNNLLLDVVDNIAKLINRSTLALKENTEKSRTKQTLKGESAINDSKEYYANAPKRAGKMVSIDRELAASGNVW